MRRDIFTEEHDLFREQFRRFVAEEVEPHIEQWNADGLVPRAIWKRMGEEGYLGANMPEEWGGAGGGLPLRRHHHGGARAMPAPTALQASLHTDICLPYLESYGSEEQKQKPSWSPPSRATDLVAIGMTEPSTGSDLAAVAAPRRSATATTT